MPGVSEQKLAAGATIPPVVKQITQEKIARYAEASGDHNPLHVDPGFAATSQFGGTIAHGMLLLAYLSEMMTVAFGRSWIKSGRLKIRFRGPARPGDTVTASGTVTSAGGDSIKCEVECRNQAGELLVSGQAEVGR
jgi:3-hydroxybutyryl-CoA dehydratase